MNVRFCRWVWRRAAVHGDRLELMLHEFALPFPGDNWRQTAVAVVHRLMATLLLQAASCVWVSIPALKRVIRPYLLGRRVPVEWLPVFSNIPVVSDPVGVQEVRARYVSPGGWLVGHFGTFGATTGDLLAPALALLLQRQPQAVVLMIGRGGAGFCEHLVRSAPELAGRLHATDGLPDALVSRHLQACDALLQPYPEGVSTRRGSAMAALAHGRPLVSTFGPATEPLWSSTGAAVLATAGNVAGLVEAVERVLTNGAERERLAHAGQTLYRARFDWPLTVAALRST
jgi:hypothetical protein